LVAKDRLKLKSAGADRSSRSQILERRQVLERAKGIEPSYAAWESHCKASRRITEVHFSLVRKNSTPLHSRLHAKSPKSRSNHGTMRPRSALKLAVAAVQNTSKKGARIAPSASHYTSRFRVGKTTHGRYLAWRFNISLVESDLFLIPNQGRLVYLQDALKHVITSRFDKPRPVIVESVAVRRLLHDLALKPDYVIYVSSNNAHESRSLKEEIDSYETVLKPAATADLIINVEYQ
jgi:hypothetical protein